VLYRAATGKAPFGDLDTLSVLSALATRTPAPSHWILPSLPRMFSGLVMRLLAKDPADRPQSAREVVEAIEALECGETAKESEPCLPKQTASSSPRGEERRRTRDQGRPQRRRVRRRKQWPETEKDWGPWVLAAGMALLVMAALAVFFVFVRHAR
jgi:serine/threonine protein kinase